MVIVKRFRGWRDGSAVNSPSCSFSGPRFESQNPHSGSQPSGTPDPVQHPLLDSKGFAYKCYVTDMCRQALIHTNINKMRTSLSKFAGPECDFQLAQWYELHVWSWHRCLKTWPRMTLLCMTTLLRTKENTIHFQEQREDHIVSHPDNPSVPWRGCRIKISKSTSAI